MDDTITTRTHQLDGVTVMETMRGRTAASTAPLHVMDQERFAAYGITDFADALNRLPGITLRDYGGAGGMKTVSVRGFGAQHTGVSYDGVMLSECQSGQIDVARYSLDNVEQVALVIGDNDDIFIPAKNTSAAATLNISTSPFPNGDKGQSLTAQLRFGSFGYVCPFFKYAQRLCDRLAVSVTGEYTYAENDYPFTLHNVTLTTKERRTNSRMNSGHAELGLAWRPGRHDQLTAKVYYYDNDRQLPGQVRYYTSLSKEQLRDRNFFGQAQYKAVLGQNLSLRADAKFNWAMSKYRDATYKNGVNDADYWQREAYASVCVLYAPTRQWAMDYSADYSFNNLNSSLSTDTKPYRQTVLQSLTAKYKTRRLTMIARLLGSLYFNDAKLGVSAHNFKRLSPSLSLSFRPLKDYDLHLRVSYKDIFRAPTFNESYFFHYGSTDLKPERTDQYNIGLTWNGRPWAAAVATITVDGYMNHVHDKIVAVPYNMFVWTNINVGKVKMLGLDATMSLTHSFSKQHSIVVSGSYSYQQAENKTNKESIYYGNQIAYVPLHSGSASIAYRNPWADVVVHGTGTSLRYGNNEHYEGTSISGYWEMGLALSRSFTLGKSRLDLRFDLKNMLNKQYEIVRLYPMPGRSWQATVRYYL
jgi:vitamin B12 transporter